jgi:outer membrane protein assembly factor BamB
VLSRTEYDFIAGVFQQSQNALLAVRPGGHGAVTAPQVAWRHVRGLPYVPAPLLYRGRLYLVKNVGLLTCLHAATGTVHFQEERLDAVGDDYASPVAADGRIAIASQSGAVAVVVAADELEVLARNPLGDPALATPAIAHDALYVRGRQHLWAFKAGCR